MTRWQHWLVVFALVGLGSSASASSILLGTDTPFLGGNPALEDTQALAQAFTLTQGVTLSSLDVWVGDGPSSAPIVVQITDSLGPGTTIANVVYSGTIPGTSVTGPVGEVSAAASVSLAPGTYYLVLSTANTLGFGWESTFGVLPSTVGTVGQGYYCCFPAAVGSFPPSETYKTLAGNLVQGSATQLHFALEGTSAPEPSAALLLALAAMVAANARRRA